jgi:hypothetical protein
MGTFTKQTCRACDGRGGVSDGPDGASECDVCSGRGLLLVNICVECERAFNMADETDAQEWSYGHDCEA